ncbi:MAG TPA: AAA family ATPase [Polyangium sp.]|nr:AAA family ATPase [Polyangium sp.]
MAKAKETRNTTSQASESTDTEVHRARLRRIKIRNFRSIGDGPIEVELDDIVVIIGPNNAGKSSILRACHVLMQPGKDPKIELSDFPNGKIPEDKTKCPQIELETVIFDEKAPGEEWIHTDAKTGAKYICERFTWETEGKCKRVGKVAATDAWHDKSAPWGLDNKAKEKRPKAYYVESFSQPADQTKKIVELLQEGLADRHQSLLSRFLALEAEVVTMIDGDIKRIQDKMTDLVSRVIPNQAVEITQNEDSTKYAKLFDASLQLRMGQAGEFMTDIDRQGSGARRTLLWAALKLHTEEKHPSNNDSIKPFLLLMDEPELCLHPSAIRNARDVLYDLAATQQWQIIITTHSPIFIDLTKDNTTIIRVDSIDGRTTGRTLYRTKVPQLSTDEQSRLKMLNHCDPYFAEFFFGGRIVVVEGDTEYSAFDYVLRDTGDLDFRDRYSDVHIIRARGKWSIAIVCSILNKFCVRYAVLHDSDVPEKANAWVANQRIRRRFDEYDCTVTEPRPRNRLLAVICNFEQFINDRMDAELGIGPNKPYRAIKTYPFRHHHPSPPPRQCVKFRRDAATNHKLRPRTARVPDKRAAKAAPIVELRHPEFAWAREVKHLGKRGLHRSSSTSCRQDEPAHGPRRQCRYIVGRSAAQSSSTSQKVR